MILHLHLVLNFPPNSCPPGFRGAYTASKHAVSAWADSLRAELASSGVGVTVISPGYVNTNLSRNALTSSGRNKKTLVQGSSLVSKWCLKNVLGYYPI